MDISVKVDIQGEIDPLLSIDKQLLFATAQALTFTARAAQRNVVDNLLENYTIRRPWYLPSNYYGVKATRATKENLTVQVSTKADWLILHETGGVKTAANSKNIAIPTENVRRSVKDIIFKSQYPRNLKGAFVIHTKSGPALFKRVKGELRLMYLLEPSVKIKQQPTFLGPAVETFENDFAQIFNKCFENAISSAKTEGQLAEIRVAARRWSSANATAGRLRQQMAGRGFRFSKLKTGR